MARTIDRFKLRNVVIDPVMVCKGVDVIMVPEAAAAIKTVLMQRADVVTPNTIEAAYLADMEKVETLDEIKEAAGRIKELGAGYVVIKSGSRNDSREAVDVLYDGREFTIASAPKIEPCYNHGWLYLFGSDYSGTGQWTERARSCGTGEKICSGRTARFFQAE